MKKITIAACAALATTMTVAQADDAVRLTKAETEALVVGKKVEYTRARDNATITYTFKEPGGDAFYSTSTTTRNIQVSGTYTITDRASVCFKWNADKYLPMQDGCVAFARDGSKTLVTNATDLTKVLGQVVE